MSGGPQGAGSTDHSGSTALESQRVAGLIGHALVFGMMVCFALTLRSFLSRLVPGWENGFLIPLSAAGAIEAMVSRRFLLRRFSLIDVQWYLVRGAEWVVLLVSLRILLYGLQGLDQLIADLETFGFQFPGYFLQAEFAGATAVLFVVWSLSTAFTQDLLAQEGDQLIDDQDTFRLALEDREVARRQMLGRTFLVGTLMVALNALSVADLAFIWQGRAPVSGGGVFILVYFVLGLVLFSLSHFSRLRAFWRWEGLEESPDLAARWAWYGLVFLSVLTLAGSLLPTRYTLSFLDFFRRLLGWFVGVVLWIAQSLWTLLILGIALVNSLLAGEQPPAMDMFPRQAPPAPPAASPAPLAESSPPVLNLLEIIASIVFWILFLTIVYYAFYFLVGKYGELIERLEVLPMVRLLVGFLRRLLGRIRHAGGEARRTLGRGLQRLQELGRVPSQSPAFRLFRPGGLPPRQRVRFYFLALVRRGRDIGLDRKPSQTPEAYAEALGKRLPEAGEELRELTAAFIRSRYTDHPVPEDLASHARSLLLKVRRLLRKRR